MDVDPATLAPNRFVDSDHPELVAFARSHAGPTPRESAVQLYYEVRDRLRYNPWRVRFRAEDYTASGVLLRDPAEGGHCIDKALLLAGACRALGIPSRLHFANVRNHVGTARLEEKLGTDLLVFHGYTELYLDGSWVAATPAFNLELCQHLGVAPLEFDGRTDSIFQEYDRGGSRFMEYVEDHGVHADIPLAQMLAEWEKHYPFVRDGVWPERA
jgi:transglutaminase-like putative cysteine protease